MALPPLTYNVRSLFVRRSSTFLTVFGIGATVAVIAGLLSLQRGFASLYSDSGRSDVVVFLRPGATSEGESAFARERADVLVKETPEIARDGEGRPLAARELYLAVRMRKADGGETNVPIRGVEERTLAIAGERLEVVEGRAFTPGADEVMVGRALTRRLASAAVGEVLLINTTPFRVVGVFDMEGPFRSELWGDVERLKDALGRQHYSRVVAQVAPGTDVAALAARQEGDKRVPTKVLSERSYFTGQTQAVSFTLWTLGAFLAVVMGTAAVFTGTNTMLSALAARGHEIGVLLAIGFRPLPVFVSFLFEALLLGFLGGLVGCLMVLPLHGVETGTTNFQTFTEVAFAFRVTPDVLGLSVGFALILGLLGGLFPAWNAARKDPAEVLRRR